jgi:hypothetical protein
LKLGICIIHKTHHKLKWHEHTLKPTDGEEMATRRNQRERATMVQHMAQEIVKALQLYQLPEHGGASNDQIATAKRQAKQACFTSSVLKSGSQTAALYHVKLS